MIKMTYRKKEGFLLAFVLTDTSLHTVNAEELKYVKPESKPVNITTVWHAIDTNGNEIDTKIAQPVVTDPTIDYSDALPLANVKSNQELAIKDPKTGEYVINLTQYYETDGGTISPKRFFDQTNVLFADQDGRLTYNGYEVKKKLSITGRLLNTITVDKIHIT